MPTETTVTMELVPGATGPLPSHSRKVGDPVETEHIPPIVIGNRSWTRMQVARETGLSLTTVSKLFTGSRKPSLKTARKLANYFGVSIERLLSEILPRWVPKISVRPIVKSN
jgi:DNA-binding XRE family transcriptional regulator